MYPDSVGATGVAMATVPTTGVRQGPEALDAGDPPELRPGSYRTAPAAPVPVPPSASASIRRALGVAVALAVVIAGTAVWAGGRWAVGYTTVGSLMVLVGFGVVVDRVVVRQEHARHEAEQETRASHNQLQK